MHRVDGTGATANNLFTEGDPTQGVPATVVDAEWLNGVQEEIANMIEEMGITLDKGTQDQLYKAVIKAGGISVDSVSALRSGSFPASLERIWLSGYYGVGTAGGGELYRDPADTTTADNGVTVFVDADGVRWKRAKTHVLHAAQAGAVGQEDDTDKINAALAALSAEWGGGVLQLDGITYTITDGIDIRSNTTLRGVGWDTKLNASGTGFTDTGLIVNTTDIPIQNPVVENLWVEVNDKDTSFGSPGLKGVVFDRPVNWRMDRLQVTNSLSYGIWAEAGFSEPDKPFSGSITNCYVVNCEELIELRDTQSALIENCTVEGGANSANGILVWGPNMDALYIRNLKSSGTTNGISISNGVKECFIDGCSINAEGGFVAMNIGTDAGANGNVGKVYISNSIIKSESDSCIVVSRVDEINISHCETIGEIAALTFGSNFTGEALIVGSRIEKQGSGSTAAVGSQASTMPDIVLSDSLIRMLNGSGNITEQIKKIVGCLIYGANSNGIFVDDDGVTVLANSIHNSRIRINSNVVGAVVSNNRITKDDATSHNYGISASGGTKGCGVNGNVVRQNSASGDAEITLSIASGAENTAVGNTVIDGSMSIDNTEHNATNNAIVAS